MKLTCCELFALWGGLCAKNRVRHSFISLIPVPKTRKTSSLHAELKGDLFSIHIVSLPLACFPISSQRRGKYRKILLGLRNDLKGNYVALIGPHSEAILGRTIGLVEKKRYRVPIWVAGLAWFAFAFGMSVLHLWFIVASLYCKNPKSALDAFNDYKKLLCKGPRSFSTYYIFNVQ